MTVGMFSFDPRMPRTLRIAEVNVDVGRQREASMIRKLFASGPRSCDLYSSCGSFFACLMSAAMTVWVAPYWRPSSASHNACGVRLVGVSCIFLCGRRSRSQWRRHRRRSSTAVAPANGSQMRSWICPRLAPSTPARLRSTNRSSRSKMAQQLDLQHATGLNKQTAINRLV